MFKIKCLSWASSNYAYYRLAVLPLFYLDDPMGTPNIISHLSVCLYQNFSYLSSRRMNDILIFDVQSSPSSRNLIQTLSSLVQLRIFKFFNHITIRKETIALLVVQRWVEVNYSRGRFAKRWTNIIQVATSSFLIKWSRNVTNKSPKGHSDRLAFSILIHNHDHSTKSERLRRRKLLFLNTLPVSTGLLCLTTVSWLRL